MASRQELKRYRTNLADELHGAAIYDALARVEADPERKRTFGELAASEQEHAKVWADKLRASHQRVRTRPGLKTVLMKGLVHVFGPQFVLPSLAAAEFADRNKYAGSPDTAKMSEDERHHASVVQRLANDGKPEATKGAQIADAESWHRGVSSGNDLRAAVLGANDGLVSNFCLVMGVAGAGTQNKAILLTAFAGIVAGACSMALGEWLSVTNARELARTQIAKEADELEHTPEAEEHELRLIYRAKGLDHEEARRVAEQIMKDKGKALDALTREELGLDPAELGGNPWSAAAVSFCLFAAGAIFPAMHSCGRLASRQLSSALRSASSRWQA